TGLFPQIAGHLLSASVIAIPAVIVTTKLLLPETETPETLSHIPPEDPATRSRNLMSAIIGGAMDGVRVAAGILAAPVGVRALVIAMLGWVALADKILGAVSGWLGMAQPLTLVKILGWLFYPLAALLGIARADIAGAARLLGERVILTEVVSYQDLAHMVAAG